eukprot:TRINITY_DN39099_c0_g1_i1.p1 TRINITY_DN39099_c0_g1~~TRINITY_DN39099_c0_g1_i1.p1  ORF type:complete len:223 (+),score=42.98 TRINITY_DN39099_c0_g1_i1:294-962(+)
MTSGGLGGMDAGMPIGGLAKELFEPLGANFEPHTAELAVERLLETTNVSLHRSAGELVSVQAEGAQPRRIKSARFSSGLVICAEVWVDCSYEGDLLRLSGTKFKLGRESSAEYNESMAGSDDNQAAAAAATPSFFAPSVSPWVDDTNSTLLPTIVEVLNGTAGASDDLVMSYCFRVCLTNNASNSPVRFTAPRGYTRAALELLRRELLWLSLIHISEPTRPY